MTVKSYFVDWSTKNEMMFEELRACGYVYDVEDWGDNFLLTIFVPDDEVVNLEDIMQWYV